MTGGPTIDRRSATTSVALVSVRLGRITTPTVLNSLAGRITGVSLQTNSGAPGGRIGCDRGNNDPRRSRPLFVVTA